MKKQSLIPPVAPKRSYVKDVHGKRLSDEYHWMRNKDAPEVRDYLNAENAYTKAMMKPSEALQKKLYREMLAVHILDVGALRRNWRDQRLLFHIRDFRLMLVDNQC